MTNYEMNNENNQNEYFEEPEANELHELYEMIKPLYEAELQAIENYDNNEQSQYKAMMSLLEDSPLLPAGLTQQERQLAAAIEFVLFATKTRFRSSLLNR